MVGSRRPNLPSIKRGGCYSRAPVPDQNTIELQLFTDPNGSGELTVMPVALSTTIGGCRNTGLSDGRAQVASESVVAGGSEALSGDRRQPDATPSR